MKEYRDNKGQLVWVAPGAVLIGTERAEWILWYLDYLREGYYPAEPTSYVGGTHQRLAKSPFEGAVLLAAEIDTRLARTGLDHYLVEDKYVKELTEFEIAKNLYMDEFEVGKRIRSVVSYIASGSIPRWLDTEERKGMSYREWVRSRTRYRMRLHTKT